jgi:hypothetical protein
VQGVSFYFENGAGHHTISLFWDRKKPAGEFGPIISGAIPKATYFQVFRPPDVNTVPFLTFFRGTQPEGMCNGGILNVCLPDKPIDTASQAPSLTTRRNNNGLSVFTADKKALSIDFGSVVP